MSEITKYLAAAISPNLPWKCRTKKDVRENLEELIKRIDRTIEANSSYLPIKLFVFPELQFNPPDSRYWSQKTMKEKAESIGVEIPGKETDLLVQTCKKHDIYLVPGSAIEVDSGYPDAYFNTAPIIGPEGVLTKHRKVNPWLPTETSLSPADLLPEYRGELWPVVKTPIGNLGVGICYDWLFPEAIRALTLNGAEILIRVSAYPQPWGGTPPREWWTLVNRCRALENVAYVIAANVGTTTGVTDMPECIWPGQNQIIDWEARLVAQAPPGGGEGIALGHIDIDMLRWVRKNQLRHNMPSHLRTEAYKCYKKTYYPAGSGMKQCAGTAKEIKEKLSNTVRESRKKLWQLE